MCWGNDQIYILKSYSSYSIGYTKGYQGPFAPIQASGSKGREEKMDLGDTSRIELIGQHILTHKKSIYIQHSRAFCKGERKGYRKAGASGIAV